MRSKLAILLVGVAACVAAVAIRRPRSNSANFSASVPIVVTNGALPFSQRAEFAVTNTGSRNAIVHVAAIEQKTPLGWVADTKMLPRNRHGLFGRVGRDSSETLSADIQDSTNKTRFRLVVALPASNVQKAKFAAQKLRERFASGDKGITQFWYPDLYVSSFEIVTPEIEPRGNKNSEKN